MFTLERIDNRHGMGKLEQLQLSGLSKVKKTYLAELENKLELPGCKLNLCSRPTPTFPHSGFSNLSYLQLVNNICKSNRISPHISKELSEFLQNKCLLPISRVKILCSVYFLIRDKLL